MNTAEEFWANTMPCPPSDCLLWIAGHSRKTGYGRVGWNGKPMDAHRAAFFIANGYWAKVTRHTCDTPLCVNPAHLLAGTQKDNIHDCIRRGRFSRGEKHSAVQKMHAKKGELNPQAKLTNGQVLQIKQLLADGQRCAEIATLYGVAPRTIRGIREGRKWGWLTLDNSPCQSSE